MRNSGLNFDTYRDCSTIFARKKIFGSSNFLLSVHGTEVYDERGGAICVDLRNC